MTEVATGGGGEGEGVAKKKKMKKKKKNVEGSEAKPTGEEAPPSGETLGILLSLRWASNICLVVRGNKLILEEEKGRWRRRRGEGGAEGEAPGDPTKPLSNPTGE